MALYHARIPREENYENHIEIDKIDKIDKAQFFDVMTPLTMQLNNILIGLCKQVFIESYNKGGKEAGAILSKATEDKPLQTAIHEATRYGVVDFDEDEEKEYYKLYIRAEEYNNIIIHNHNTRSSFSAPDIYTFLKSGTTFAIVVVTSDANIIILIKEKYRNYSKVIQCIEQSVKTDYITPEIRDCMIKHGLIERRVN